MVDEAVAIATMTDGKRRFKTMARKKWFEIEVECIKYSPSITMLVGEKMTVARVVGESNAYTVAKALRDNVYKSENFMVKFK